MCDVEEDHTCPVCFSYIYNVYACENKHKLCGNCYIKVLGSPCPICRNKNINKSQIDSQYLIKKCKNLKCDKMLFPFDDEHEKTCIHNPLQCVYCNNVLSATTNAELLNHYLEYCSNEFKNINYKNQQKNNQLIITVTYPITRYILTIRNMNNDIEYILLLVRRGDKTEVMPISLSAKYIKSNYAVTICDNADIDHRLNICFNRFEKYIIEKNTIKVITTEFILDRETKEYIVDGVKYFENTTVDGEPGSAGNWDIDFYEETTAKFISDMEAISKRKQEEKQKQKQ